MALNKEAILSADDLKQETIQVPEWKGEVIIRTMTGEERDAFDSEMIRDDKKSFKNIRARFLSLIICDEQGNRLFDDKEIAQLGKKSAAALDRLFSAGQKLNRLSNDDIEELAGNSEPTQKDSSNTD